MRVTVHYLAQLKRALGRGQESVDVEPGCTLVELLRQLATGPDPCSRTLLVDSGGGPSRGLLFFVVVHILWRKPLRVAVAGAVAFLIVDLTFFAANLPKVVHGGWFPLAIAAIVFLVLTTWQRGREIVTQRRTGLEGPLQDFIEEIRTTDKPLERVPRTGIFLDANPETAPLALRANVEHNCVLHESVVIVQVQTLNVPHVEEDERVTVDDLGYRDDGITHVTARFGFQDDIDVPLTLRKAAKRMEREADFDAVSYFLSRISIIPGDEPGMARWRKKLFIAIARNASSPVAYFNLPDDRTIVMASHVEL